MSAHYLECQTPLTDSVRQIRELTENYQNIKYQKESEIVGLLEKVQGRKDPIKIEHPPSSKRNVRDEKYHRVILSSIQYLQGDKLTTLREQCKGLRVHHEISANFSSHGAVERYCQVLHVTFDGATAKTAGMNAEELQSFTSWYGTEVFEAVASTWGDSLVQRFIRAKKVREAFNLDWVYVHGNELDIAVVKADADENIYQQLQQAMLFSKVGVFAALLVRSGCSVSADFTPCCSPKGFLSLYQFAQDFARQFASTSAGDQVKKQLLEEGYLCVKKEQNIKDIPGVVIVPVYWPDPPEGFSATGAGDICSGIVAALGP